MDALPCYLSALPCGCMMQCVQSVLLLSIMALPTLFFYDTSLEGQNIEEDVECTCMGHSMH